MDLNGDITKELKLVAKFRADTDRAEQSGVKVHYSKEELAEIVRAINIVNERCRNVTEQIRRIEYTEKYRN